MLWTMKRIGAMKGNDMKHDAAVVLYLSMYQRGKLDKESLKRKLQGGITSRSTTATSQTDRPILRRYDSTGHLVVTQASHEDGADEHHHDSPIPTSDLEQRLGKIQNFWRPETNNPV